MPKPITSLRLFVASPSDLDEERKLLAGVVQELNSYLPQRHEVFIDLLTLDAHVSPGVGTDPQNVINQKLPTDYDILIAMFWTRIGTPTPRSQSGTIEEIENAYSRWQENHNSVRLMIYFKNTPISPSNINLDQITQLYEYQKSLGEKGILYSTFTDSDEFSQILRLHIAKEAIELLKGDRLENLSIEKEGTVAAASKPQRIVEDEIHDEEGFLDSIDTTVKTLDSSRKILNEITDSLKVLSGRTELATHELSSVDKEDQHKLAKLILISNRQAQNMQDFVFKVKPIIPIFDESLHSGLDAYGRSMILLTDFGSSDENRKQLVEIMGVAANLRDAMISSDQSMGNFRSIVSGLPRITTQFSKAKRDLILLLDEIITTFERGISLANEIEVLGNNMLSNWDSQDLTSKG